MDKKIDMACHIRTLDRAVEFDRFFSHIEIVYGSAVFCDSCLDREISLNLTRLYIGDEFCPHRLPDLKQLDTVFAFTEENRLALTVLTPPLSDREMERYTPLFDVLSRSKKNIEIVVNDMGMILFLQKEFPSLQLAAGRLLNKAFKDPRLTDVDGLLSFSKEAEVLLNECTFDNEVFQTMMTGHGIWRMEQDLLPYGHGPLDKISGVKTSVYFPFGAITSGRVCWTSTFDMPEESWFMPLDRCSRPCEGFGLVLENSNFAFQVVQAGNTIFYLYPKKRLGELFEKALQGEIRLVYQGFAI